MSGDSRSLARQLVASRDTAGSKRRCAYCGEPCLGVACKAHADLPRLEPHREVVAAGRENTGEGRA